VEAVERSRRIVLATRNPDKVREMAALFGELPVSAVVSVDEVADLPEVIEDGETLRENALKKAREIAGSLGELCVADDTGLEVDALDGAPGIYAARYAGPDATYADNCEKLQREMAGRTLRTARFRTVMAAVDPLAGWECAVDGVLEGEILEEPKGDRGFGYDPLFWVPEVGRGLAELTLDEKNRISHRARAAAAMLQELKRHLVGA
jgi:XTP/dITP diphosphohydrolase